MVLPHRRRRPATTWADEHAADLTLYETLLQRELSQNAMLWQTPALAITAQAFLITLAFTPTDPDAGRLAAAVLGSAVAAMSMQLMAKHRYLERKDRAQMARLEELLTLPQISAGAVIPRTKNLPTQTWFTNRSSYLVWQVGFILFLAANVLAVTLVLMPHFIPAHITINP